MRRSPRAVLWWCVAALSAVATAVVVAGDLAALHRQARDLGPLVPVVVAARDLELGAPVRAGDVRLVERHRDQVDARALATLDQAEDRTVAVPVLRGAAVTDRHLTGVDRPGVDGLVPPGLRAVRVPDDTGLAPPAGAVVDVLATVDPAFATASDLDARAEVVAAGAVVLDASPAAADAVGATGSDDGFDPGGGAWPAGVVLLVPEAESRRLAFALATGSLTLAIAPPEDACCNPSSSASSRG